MNVLNVLLKTVKKLFTSKEPISLPIKEPATEELNCSLYLPVKDFEDHYTISPDGQVFGKHRTTTDAIGRTVTRYPRKISCYQKNDGYIAATLAKHGERYCKYVHRMVAEVYVPNPDPSTHIYVRFKDGNRSNVKHTNLEWSKQSCDADYVSYKEKSNRKYGAKVNNEILDLLLTRVLNKTLNVTQAASLTGYGVSYMSVILRRRAKEVGLIEQWYSAISRRKHDNFTR